MANIPIFSRGDKVVFKADYDKLARKDLPGHFSGKVYTIKRVQEYVVLNPDYFLEEAPAWVSGFDEHVFDRVPAYAYQRERSEGRYIVIVELDGKLAPATTPKEYYSKEQAEKVADDMARRHGGKFFVFRATYETVNEVRSRQL